MILLDAVYINNSGGKVLLDYLILSLEKNNVEVSYLLDSRIKSNHPQITHNKINFIKATLKNRFLFYSKNKSKFDSILCFGNIPPPVSCSAKVYVYFHQKLFLNPSSAQTHLNRLAFRIKSLIFNLHIRKEHSWIVQTMLMRDELISHNKKIHLKNTLVIPFYPPLVSFNRHKIRRDVDSFIYVSSGSPHKNHKILINSFVKFYNTHKKGKLFLTITEEYSALLSKVNFLIEQGFPIVNLGMVDRKNLADIYRSCEYTIYPSQSESFGLGLIEAMENGCNVIGSDLSYTHAVCKPSITFDNKIEKSVIAAFEKALAPDVKPSVQLAKNEIDNLISLLI